MLSKVFRQTQSKGLVSMMKRGVYTKETQPHVFINQHTKVLVQGMTGKHVSIPYLKYSSIIFYRVLSIQKHPSLTEPRLSEESIRERLALLILEFQFTPVLARV